MWCYALILQNVICDNDRKKFLTEKSFDAESNLEIEKKKKKKKRNEKFTEVCYVS